MERGKAVCELAERDFTTVTDIYLDTTDAVPIISSWISLNLLFIYLS